MKLLKLVPENTNIGFLKWRHIAITISIILTVAFGSETRSSVVVDETIACSRDSAGAFSGVSAGGASQTG